MPINKSEGRDIKSGCEEKWNFVIQHLREEPKGTSEEHRERYTLVITDVGDHECELSLMI